MIKHVNCVRVGGWAMAGKRAVTRVHAAVDDAGDSRHGGVFRVF